MSEEHKQPSSIQSLHQALGIPAEYSLDCKLPLCVEPTTLVDTELDFYQRPQRLVPEALKAWTAMREAATEHGVSLFLISAFRGYQYQHDLIAAKLKKGQQIDQILRVNAAPGYSEHHTGRAVDVGTLGCDALSEEFENTPAFQWLKRNSSSFGFRLSYPKGNEFGIDFEPWHWCYVEE